MIDRVSSIRKVPSSNPGKGVFFSIREKTIFMMNPGEDLNNHAKTCLLKIMGPHRLEGKTKHNIDKKIILVMVASYSFLC